MSDETQIGDVTWRELKREAMRDEFDKSKKFSTYSEDEQELINKLIDAQRHAANDLSELSPSFVSGDLSEEASDEEDEGIQEFPFARVEQQPNRHPTQDTFAIIGFWKQTE